MEPKTWIVVNHQPGRVIQRFYGRTAMSESQIYRDGLNHGTRTFDYVAIEKPFMTEWRDEGEYVTDCEYCGSIVNEPSR
jgi:hypothetical protein